MRTDPDRERDPSMEAARAASAMECTGLVPALPEEDGGVEQMAALYCVVPPEPRTHRG